MKRVAWLACLLAVAATAAVHAQQVIGPNVNVISGINDFITGDPFLRQQNEPSMAVSVRNPEHMLAAANDYRTIEINQEFGVGEPSATLGMTPPSSKKEAWIGVYRSYDRGKSWLGSLAPGSPNDQSRASLASPSKGLNAGSDPAVVADTAGHFYVGYLAFTRGGNSKIVVARYTDRNNSHIVDTILYDFTKEVDRGSGNAGGAGSMNGVFLDKLWMAVDHSRTLGASADACGNVYIAYTKFDGVQKDGRARSSLLFSRSTDCGQTWSTPSKLNQPSNGSPNIRNQGVYLGVDPGNGDVFAYWPDYYEPHLLMVRSQDGGQSWIKPVRITANYPLSPYAQPSIAVNSVNSSGQTLGVTFRSKSLPAVAIDGDGRHYVAIQEAVGPGVTYGATTYRAPRITLRITKDPMGTWPAPKVAVAGNGPQVMPAMLAINGLVTLMYYEAVPRTPGTCPAPDPATMRCSKTLPNGSPIPDGQSRMDDAAGLDPATHYISGMDREMNVWIAQAEPSDNPDFTGRLAKTSLFAFDPKVKAPADNRIERFFPNLPTNVSGTTPFIGDYNALAALNFVRADAPVTQGATATTSSQAPWRWAMGKSDGPGTVQGIWADTRAVVAPLLGDWQNFQTFPSCINPGSRNVNVYTTEISPGIVAGSPQPFGRLRPRDAVKDTSTTFVLYAENRTPDMRRFKFAVQAPNSVASFAQFFKDTAGPALTVEDWVMPYGTSTRTLYAWLGSGSPTAAMRVTVDDVSLAPRSDNPRGWVAPGSELASTNVLLNPDPNNPAIVDKENHGTSVSAPQQPGPQQPGTSFGAPQQPGPQQPGPQQPGPQQPGSQVGEPQQPGTLVGDSSAQVVTWTTTGVGDVASAVNSITAITNYNALKATHDFQLIAYRYLTNPVPASATVPGTQYCSMNGRVAYVIANVINPNLAPQQPGPQQPGPQQPGPQQPGTGIINFYVSPQQPGTAVDDGTTSAPRQSDQVQVTLIVSPKPGTSTANGNDAGGPADLGAEQSSNSVTFDPNLAVHGDIPAAVDTDNTQQQGPTVTTSFQAPELTIGGTPGVAPQPVTAGTRLNVVGLTLSNTGNQPPNASDGNFETRYYLSTDKLPSITAGDLLLSDGGIIGTSNSNLLPGTSVSLDASLLIPGSVLPGGYYLKVVTDEDNEVAEGTELKAALGFSYVNDNFTTFPVNVLTVVTPDLVVCGTPSTCSTSQPANPTPVVIIGLNDGATPNPARVLAGGQITVSPFAVENQGPGDAYKASETDFLLSSNIPILLATDATPILLAGQSSVRGSFTLTVPADTSIGDHSFIVQVDATNAFPHEADLLGAGSGENNNSVTTPLRLVNPLFAVNDAVATAEDQTVVIHVLGNEPNPNGAFGDTNTIVSVTQPIRGVATISENATTITYTPDATKNGDDSFSYMISDGRGQRATATVTVKVNDRPTADAKTVSTNEDTSVGIVLTGSDRETAAANLTFNVTVPPQHGSLSAAPIVGSPATITYTPNLNYNGPDSFQYTVTDRGSPDNCGVPSSTCAAALTGALATVSITVIPVNDPPAATAQSVSTNEDTPLAIVLTGSDVETAAANLMFAIVTPPAHGLLSGTPPNVTYTPNGDYNGPDSFTFTVTDRGDPDNCGTASTTCAASMTSAAATVSITVVPVNDAPAATAQSVSLNEDTTAAITLSGSDLETSDPATLTYAIVAGPTNGTLSGTGRSRTYTPNANYNGPDSFTFTVTDRGDPDDCGTVSTTCAAPMMSAAATMSITVVPVNDAPVAADDAGVASAGASTFIDVLVNDSDVDGDTLTIQSFTQGAQGSVSPFGTGLNYTPGPGFVDTDSFTYTISDGHGGTATATVRIYRRVSIGDIVISEFRFRGAGDGVDQFIELYNNTDEPITVRSLDGSSGWSVVEDGGRQLMFLPNGTMIAPRGHLLGTQWYSHDQPPGVGSIVHPYAGVAQIRLGSEFNFTWGYYDGHQIPENSGIALFGTTASANWTFNTRIDAVGFQTSNSLYLSGGGLTPIVLSDTEKSFVRRSIGFTAQNTFNNSSDFVLVSTDTTPIATTKGGSIQPVVGAPGPEHFSAPRYATNVGSPTLVATLLDTGVSGTAAPNQVRSGNVLTLRRTLTNTGGTAISRVRLRVVDISTLGSRAGYEADLRAMSAANQTVTLSSSSNVDVIGAQVETIPAQPNGGGLNSGLEIPLTASLAPGQSIGVQLSFNVVTEGTYRFNTDVPIAPVILPAPFLTSATAVQPYTGGTLSAVGAATPTWTLVTGGTLLAQYGLTFNSNGTITGTPSAAGSIPLTVRLEDAATGLRAERSYFLNIGGPLDVSPFQMRAVVGEFFSGVRLVGGRGIRQFQLLSPLLADIPSGLAFDPNVGLIGTPKATGTFELSFRITDCNLQSGTPSCPSDVAQQDITRTVPITIITVEQQGFGDPTVQPVAFGGSGGRSLAQVFTSGVGGVLDSIRLNQLSCPTGTQVTVNILRTDNSAPFKPFGSPIATGTGYIGLLFNGPVIPLSSPVSLSPGLRLAFEVQTDAVCAMLRLPPYDNYGGGAAFAGSGGAFELLSATDGRFDLVFRTMTRQDGLLYTTVPLGWHTATPLLAADGTLNGGKILLAGPSGAAAIYDPATHELLQTGAMGKSRQNHTATLLRCPATSPSCAYNGTVLITGGKSFPGAGTTIYESSAELFDPKANGGVGAFSDVAAQLGGSTPRARIYHTATRLEDGRVLIVGGRSTDDGTTGIQDAEFFDPEAMAFTPGPLDTTRRWHHTATLIAGGKVLVAGGYTAAGLFTSAQIYDPATDQFALPSGGGLHFNRGQHTATLLPASGKVLIVGGEWANTLVTTAELFDPTTKTFTDAGNIAEGRVDAAAVALADGASVLIAGGNSSNFCCPVLPPLASIERYIGGTSWQSAGSMVVARPNLSMTLLTGGLNSGTVLAASGGGASFVTAQSVELIDPAATLGLASAPPAADLGQSYDFTLSVAGVAAEFHHVAGSLPPGLTFDDGTGHIGGVVDTNAAIGTYQFAVLIVDTANPSRRSIQTLGIRVLAPFVISTSAVPTALTGRNYAQSLTASGGSGARMWTIIAGSLPPGLMLGRDGVLFGSPTTTAPGSFSVTLQATDDTGHLTTKVITVNVGLPADESEWTTTFPYGASIVGAGLAVDQGDANSVYVVAQNRGLYRTTDKGDSWISVTDHLQNFSTQVGTTSKFFDKSNFNVVRMIGSGLASTLYVVTQNNVFKTADQGATWTFSGNGIGGSVETLVVAPSNPAVLYAGTFANGVYQTTDGAANWTAMSSLPLAANSTTPSSIRAIAVDPVNPALVYVGTNDQGVYKFENGGWSQIGGPQLKRVDSLVIKPDLSVLFAVGQDSSDGVFRLYLGTSGDTWHKATTPPTGGSNPFFSAGCCNSGDKIAIDPLNASSLYVATANSGIWISTDGAASLTFQPITGLQSSTVAVATGIVDATPVIYVGTSGQGVYKSLDGGSDWLEASTGLRAINFPHGNVHSLAFDATSPSKVYAGSVARGFRSVDGGASWQPKTTWNLPGFSANAIATHQAEPGVVYAFGSSSGFGNTCCFNLWKSDSSGTNFQPISINTGTGNLCCWGDGDIALHPSQPLTMWVAASNFNPGELANGVYVTTDGGATWSLLSNTGLTNTNAHSLTIDPADPDSPYLVVRGSFSAGSTPGGVFKRNGVSSSWDKLPIIPSTQTDQTFNPDQILVNPGNGDLLVTAQGSSSNSGLYRSTDGGATWSRVLNDNVSAVAVNPLNTNQVYVGTWNSGGFRRSSDGGTTWVPANEGLPLQPTIESIVLDPTNPYRVLLATEGGVWVRTFPSGAAGDVSLTKTAAPATLDAGHTVTFTMRATNTGPSPVTGVVITDPLPTGAIFEPSASSTGCSLSGNIVSCSVGTLNSTERATITIVVTVTASGTMTNTAAVSADQTDPNIANNSAAATVAVNSRLVIAGSQTAPDRWTYNLTFASLDNYSIFQLSTTITVSGLCGVTSAGGPTSTDFPEFIDEINRNWTAEVLSGGTAVRWTHTGPGTGNFGDEKHIYGFFIAASGAVDGLAPLVTSGFSRDTTNQLPDGTFNRDISITVHGPKCGP